MIAKRIKDYIDEQGIKQGVMAREIGMSGVAMSQTLNGKRTLTADELVGICRFLRVPVETFTD